MISRMFPRDYNIKASWNKRRDWALEFTINTIHYCIDPKEYLPFQREKENYQNKHESSFLHLAAYSTFTQIIIRSPSNYRNTATAASSSQYDKLIDRLTFYYIL